MALGDPYATLAKLKSRLGINDTTEDTALTDALDTATLGINLFCHRIFWTHDTATARVYNLASRSNGLGIVSSTLAFVDDFHTTTGLIIATDAGDDGVYETTWAATDWQLEPLNGVRDGMTGWPYWVIRAVGDHRFPTSGLRAPLQQTAKWGWSAVPKTVQESCLIVAEEVFKLKDAPFGVAGVGEWGMMRVRDNPMVAAKLKPYQRDAILVA